MPTWADPARLQPRWVLWALLGVLVLDVRAVVHLQPDEGARCAEGIVPRSATALSTSITLAEPTTRSGDDVAVVLRMENNGSEDVLVAGLQALVVEPAGSEVVSWAEPARPLGLVVRPGEFGEVTLVGHLARCEDRPETALAPGWYELVVVLVEPDGRRRSSVRPLVVGR